MWYSLRLHLAWNVYNYVSYHPIFSRLLSHKIVSSVAVHTGDHNCFWLRVEIWSGFSTLTQIENYPLLFANLPWLMSGFVDLNCCVPLLMWHELQEIYEVKPDIHSTIAFGLFKKEIRGRLVTERLFKSIPKASFDFSCLHISIFWTLYQKLSELGTLLLLSAHCCCIYTSLVKSFFALLLLHLRFQCHIDWFIFPTDTKPMVSCWLSCQSSSQVMCWLCLLLISARRNFSVSGKIRKWCHNGFLLDKGK